ncbi:MAG: alpha/beta hydrolase [Limisphaerales bacterium]
MKPLLLVSLLCFATHGLAADPALTKKTHVYKTVGPVRIQADVHRPPGVESRPVLVWLHGGALIVGSRTQVPRTLIDLCTQERWVLVSLDYRLAPEVKLPDIAEDLRDAFRWLHADGPRLFQADTRHVVVAGGSAGGFLTMLAGVVVQPRPSALLAYWGYGDIDSEWARSRSQHHGAPVAHEEALAAVHQGRVLTNTDDTTAGKARGNYYRHLRQTGGWASAVTGMDPTRELERLKPYCPVRLITRNYPAILMVHGTEDTDVPYACSSDMARELTRMGVKHELITVPGGEHGLRGADAKVVAQAHERVAKFLREQMTSPDAR